MSALDDFVFDSACSYLQSVVYVDDKIYFRDHPVDIAGLPEAQSPSFFDTEPKNHKDSANTTTANSQKSIGKEDKGTNASELKQQEYHPKELVDSFAEKGIVCALYEPSEGESVGPESNMFKLCERADIVVLDWDLYNDHGKTISELLANLIEKSESVCPHHVRLCAIYTNQPSLHPITDSLLNELKFAGCDDLDVVEGKLQLAAGATRISILGKPNVTGRPPDDNEYVVEERKLADRLLRDFCEMHKGLLSGLALKGLASIRQNTKRLLDKFSSDLDGAFLLHRALAKSDREALEELPELLSDELASILQDSLLRDIDCEAVIKDTISTLGITDKSFCSGLEKGTETKKRKVLLNHDEIISGSKHSSSEKLSCLFSNRTQYILESPNLKFGTVVKHRKGEGEEWKYSICLMPICDSCNRSKPADRPNHMSFPFWRLESEITSSDPKGPKKFGFVIEDENKTISLGAGGKIRDMLWLIDIELSNDGWAKADSKTREYKVISEKGLEIQWVSELKALHVQRIATHVGTEASRVGLVESEWMRLLCS